MILKTRIYFILNKREDLFSPRDISCFHPAEDMTPECLLGWAFLFDIKIQVLCANPFVPALQFFFKILNAPHRDKSSQFVGEKSRKINSRQKQQASFVSQDRFFFSNLPSTREGMSRYAYRHVHYTRGHSQGDSTEPSLPSAHGAEEREKKRDSGNTRKEERWRACGSQRDRGRFDEESERARERVLLRSPIPVGRKRARCSVLRWSPSGQVASLSQPPLLRSTSVLVRPAVRPTVKRARASRLIASN